MTHENLKKTSSTLPDATVSPSGNIDIATVFQELTQRRETKPQHQAIAIPDALWQKTLLLGQKHGGTKIRALFGISGKQYEKRHKQFCASPENVTNKKADAIQFCEVKAPVTSENSTKSVYKPLEIPHANNVTVVEFCRSDGQIMKIHTTTHNLNTIIHSFFEGQTHATHTASSEPVDCHTTH